MSIHLPPTSPFFAISDKIGVLSSVLVFIAFIAATFFWGWLKENGYLLKVAAGILIFLIIIQILGPQNMPNFIFLGVLLGWVIWKMDSNKDED